MYQEPTFELSVPNQKINNRPTESKNMLDYFHHEDIQKSQFYIFIMIAITILSLGSSIYFISVKLQWSGLYLRADTSNGVDLRRHTEETTLHV